MEGSMAEGVFAGPLYEQVALHLRGRILRCEWSEGVALPNEVDLARECRVSIGTMRRALEILEQERLIVRKQGRGTFVSPAKIASGTKVCPKLLIHSEELVCYGAKWSFAAGLATGVEASELRIRKGEAVIRIQVNWNLMRDVRCVDMITLPARLVSQADAQLDLPEDAYRRYRGYFLTQEIIESVSAAPAAGDLADLLDVAPATSVLTIQQTVVARGGGAIEFCQRHVWLGSAARYIHVSAG